MKTKVLFVLILLAFTISDVHSQCSMCNAVVESSQKNGSELAEGLNAGILYLMGVPYLLLVGLGIVLFRKVRAKQ